MRVKSRDPFFLGLLGIFVVAGFLILSSASLMLFEEGSSPFRLVGRQIVFGLIPGVILFLIADKIHYRFWHKAGFWLFLVVFLLTLLVFVPGLGLKSGGATRWLAIGPILFQPSEFLKIAFMVYLSAWLYSRRNDIDSLQAGVIPLLLMIAALSAIFIKQPDLGTLGIIAASGFFLFFTAGGKLTHLGVAGIFVLAFLALTVYFKPYSFERVRVFFDRNYDPQGAGYQTRQAAIALGSGGILGKGFGQGVQKYNYLPESTTDAVFAVAGEEFGFLGAATLIFLFLALFWRSVIILRRAPDTFARLLGSGIVITITIQAFVNMAAISGIFFLTGLTLPFISQGGSSLAAILGAMGILSNISKQ